MTLVERFLKYVTFDTQSDQYSGTVPSTSTQMDFAKVLLQEVKDLGIEDVHLSDHGYVYGSIPSNVKKTSVPTIGFIAHMDTADTFKGPSETPRIIKNYDGESFKLESGVIMNPNKDENLRRSKGCDLIVTNGYTLLGGDDKAGIAEIMTALEKLLTEDIPHGKVAFAFTPDEEIGSGMEDFDINAFGAKYAYTLDGAGFGEIEYENFNAAAAKIEVKGVTTHPGEAKDKMINASLVAMEFDNMLPAWRRPEHTDGYDGFYHLLDVKGNCEHCEMNYIVREANRSKFEAMKEYMNTVADQLNEQYGEGTVTITIKAQYYNMAQLVEPHKHIVENAKKGIINLGGTPKSSLIRGGTDGASLTYMGVPCPNLGNGSFNHHGVTEFANIQQMEKCSDLVIEIVKAYVQ
ncbi:MAG: peptidase T [Lachnospiraceae bacterium]|nr:peptidase T [Lachnospiraceae bacterium]